MMASEFSDQVPLYNLEFELLPLFHTCDCFDGRRYIKKSELTTGGNCSVFGEKLVYLFYGRPAFKYKAAEGANRDVSLYPLAFMIKADALTNVKRIFPFDSGAMHHDKYKSYFNEKMRLADFELDPSTNRIKDLIIHFYETNENYLLSVPSEMRKNNKSDFEENCYAEMVRSWSSSPADERRGTIEVQVEEKLKIGQSNLLAMIVPTQLLDDALFVSFVEANHALIESYEISSWDPIQNFGVLDTAAKELVRRLGRK